MVFKHRVHPKAPPLGAKLGGSPKIFLTPQVPKLTIFGGPGLSTVVDQLYYINTYVYI